MNTLHQTIKNNFLILSISFYLFFINRAYAFDTLDITSKSDINAIVNIVSNPAGAKIIIDNILINKKTPDLLYFTDTLEHSIELSLPYHLFSRRNFKPKNDTTITLSYKLLSLSDTTIIISDLELGIISLPPSPIKTPYLIDDNPVYIKNAILNAGLHKVEWDGGNIYSSLDTVLEVLPGKMTLLNFSPYRLSGKISIKIIPEDAQIYLNEIPYGVGSMSKFINSGNYNVKIRRAGFFESTTHVKIFKDSTVSINIVLDRIPDEDGDGFLDSVDQCINLYGLYDGCPKQKKGSAIKKYFRMLGQNLKNQPFSLELLLASWQYRKSHSKRFSDFSSYFNDGKKIFNNHTGLSLFNSLKLSGHGFFMEFEFSQYRSGLKYSKQYDLENGNTNGPILFSTDNDSLIKYVLYSDSIANIYPALYFPSVNLSGGINFNLRRVNISFLAGYQWEDIISTDIITYENFLTYTTNKTKLHSPIDGSYNGDVKNIRYSNDWAFIGLAFGVDLLKTKRNQLALNTKVRIGIYSETNKGWNSFNVGISYKFTPSVKKQIGISTQKN